MVSYRYKIPIYARLFHKLVMRSLLADLSVGNYQNLICRSNESISPSGRLPPINSRTGYDVGINSR